MNSTPIRGAVLLDIDGTLVRMDGSGRDALTLTFARLLAVDPDSVAPALQSVDFRGNTDRAIVAQIAVALQQDGHRGNELLGELIQHGWTEQWVELYVEHLSHTVTRGRKTLLGGVSELLATLANLPLHVGLLTGNLRACARVKLDVFELGYLADRTGAFGEDGMQREQLAQRVFERLSPTGIRAEQIVFVGDTVRDIRAARSIGARCVAVATGWTEMETLQQAGADLVLQSLRDPALYSLLDDLSS